MTVLATLFVAPSQTQAQYYGYAAGTSSPPVGATAPGRLQPAYMPTAQLACGQPEVVQDVYQTHDSEPHDSASAHNENYAAVQPSYYSPAQVGSPASRYENAEQMVNSRVPRGNDLSATDQHTLLQYRRLYRKGTTPHPSELAGQWNGVNKGIVEIAGYGQFIKDIRVNANGHLHGDNVQVGQVKPSQVRLDGWQRKFDYATSDYQRRGKFAVQAPSGRGFFGRGATFSYADGNNPDGDPARLLKDEVVKLDDNHMIGRAVVEFGPIKIPLSYFVLERRE